MPGVSEETKYINKNNERYFLNNFSSFLHDFFILLKMSLFRNTYPENLSNVTVHSFCCEVKKETGARFPKFAFFVINTDVKNFEHAGFFKLKIL